MPFYKREDDQVMSAPNFVLGPGFELRAENHEEHTYPVDGWYWFDTFDAALIFFANPVSVEITPLQAMIYLSRMVPEQLSTVEAAISAAGPEAQLIWAKASSFKLTSPLLVAMGAALGWGPEQLATMFAEAKLIEV